MAREEAAMTLNEAALAKAVREFAKTPGNTEYGLRALAPEAPHG